jgi:hydroxymethylpyrimidine pyrophosphatase-like HAD family hydrolase
MDYVFGDDHGDVEMIKNAYYGALLNNSHIKDLCDNVTEFDCDNDGVIRHMYGLMNR